MGRFQHGHPQHAPTLLTGAVTVGQPAASPGSHHADHVNARRHSETPAALIVDADARRRAWPPGRRRPAFAAAPSTRALRCGLSSYCRYARLLMENKTISTGMNDRWKIFQEIEQPTAQGAAIIGAASVEGRTYAPGLPHRGHNAWLVPVCPRLFVLSA